MSDTDLLLAFVAGLCIGVFVLVVAWNVTK
jgi:hypothetical protein